MNASSLPVVLITGASSGIGRASASYLSGRGYRVFGTSRHPSPPSEPSSFEMIEMDVTDDDSVCRAIDLIITQAGRLDAVVNNAGVVSGGSLEDTPMDEARWLFETNFFGTLRVCKAVLPIMRKQRSGYIVNISSLAGRLAAPYQGQYSATKFAIEGFSEALRMEVKRFGIHVVMIEPGDMPTGNTASRHKCVSETYAEDYAKAIEVINHDERHGANPEQVGRLLERILRNPSPRLRYTVGHLDQRAAVWVKRIAPERLMEWIMMDHYRLR